MYLGIIHRLILYPNASLLNLNQILSLKGYCLVRRLTGNPFMLINPVVVEVAIRPHNEHESITTVKVTRRQKVLHLSRLTKPIVPHLPSNFHFFLPIPPTREVRTMLREIDKLVSTDAFSIL